MKKYILISFLVFCLIKSGLAVEIPLSTTLKVIEDKTYFLHQVEKGQTLYSICKLYEIDIQDIIRNSDKPALQDGEILTIPAKEKILAQLFKNKDLNKKIVYLSDEDGGNGGNGSNGSSDSSSIESSEQLLQYEQYEQPEQLQQIETTDTVQYRHPKVINLALLLPLNLGNIDQIDINNNSAVNQRYFAYASALEAALLAAKNYEENPDTQKLSLYIYDVSDENSAKKLMLNGKLQKDKINVMIGPVFLKSFVSLADYAKKNNILIINPLSDKEFLKQNHLTVKVNTSEEKILQQIIQDALVNDSTTLAKDLILIYDSLPKHRKHCDFVKNLLAEHSYFANIKTVNIGGGNIQNLNKVLSENNKNILLYLSDNEAFISQIISNTSKQKGEKKLYCTKFFDVFNQQELKYMEAIDLHFVTLFSKDKQDEKVKDFEKQFYTRFNTLPDANAFLFYDLTNMVIKSVYTVQNEQLSLENIKYEGLGYSFYFLRNNLSNENGLENVQIRIVRPAL